MPTAPHGTESVALGTLWPPYIVSDVRLLCLFFDPDTTSIWKGLPQVCLFVFLD